MRRPALRALMVLVGLATLSVYLLGAYGGYLLVRLVWELRPDPAVVAVYLVALTLAFAYVSYQVGTARILRQLRVQSLPAERAPRLYDRLEAFGDEMGLATPEVLVAAMERPNALALGGGFGRGSIVVDRRLFRILTFDELSAILAHEMAHLERRDSLVQTLGFSALQTLAGVAMLLLAPALLLATGLARGVAWVRGRPADWERTLPGRAWSAVTGGVTAAFFLLTLALLAHSRRREYAADDRAADVTDDPLALARALRKIERASESPWSLLSPLYVSGDEEGPLVRMLSTHPDTDDRVARLRERAAAAESGRGRRIEVR